MINVNYQQFKWMIITGEYLAGRSKASIQINQEGHVVFNGSVIKFLKESCAYTGIKPVELDTSNHRGFKVSYKGMTNKECTYRFEVGTEVSTMLEWDLPMNDNDETTKETTLYFDKGKEGAVKTNVRDYSTLGFRVVFKDKNVPEDTKQDFNVIITKIELI